VISAQRQLTICLVEESVSCSAFGSNPFGRHNDCNSKGPTLVCNRSLLGIRSNWCLRHNLNWNSRNILPVLFVFLLQAYDEKITPWTPEGYTLNSALISYSLKSREIDLILIYSELSSAGCYYLDAAPSSGWPIRLRSDPKGDKFEFDWNRARNWA